MDDDFKALIVTPCFNEGKTLPNIIPLLREMREKSHFTPLFIDDGSDDSTRKTILGSGLDYILFDGNKGKTQAILAGVDFARKNDYKFFATIDADIQHLTLDSLDKLFQPLDEIDMNGNPRFQMNVADVDEGWGKIGWAGSLVYSGQRAFRTDSFYRYFYKKEGGGTGLWTDFLDNPLVRWPEPAFNLLIPKTKTRFLGEIIFKHRRPYREEDLMESNQGNSHDRIHEIRKMRNVFAKALKGVADIEDMVKAVDKLPKTKRRI